MFSTKTGYWALDQRIALTWAKKASLLMVLEHPDFRGTTTRRNWMPDNDM